MKDSRETATAATELRVQYRKIHFGWLCGSIIVFILLSPWYDALGFLTIIGLSVVLIAATYSTAESGNVWIPSLLAVGALTLAWIGNFVEFPWLNLVARGVYMGVFLYSMIRVFNYVIRSSKVTLNVLMAGVSVYLLLGLAWTMFYLVIMDLSPNAFAGNITESPVQGVQTQEMLYYSFVTLTTVGYGDIAAISPLARALSILEVLSGVLYLGILVARLVSMYRDEANSH